MEQRERRAFDDAIERCVAAGLAVRRADRAAAELRVASAEHRDLTPTEWQRLVEIEAEAARLSKAFVALQGPLREAGPALFQQRFAEVKQQIEERLRKGD
jgi:hypothetical protein